jgi:hypothetical protein
MLPDEYNVIEYIIKGGTYIEDSSYQESEIHIRYPESDFRHQKGRTMKEG